MRIPAGPVPQRDLAQPGKGDELSNHYTDILQPEQEHATREYPVEQRHRPHDEFGMVLPELELTYAVVRIEVAMGDQVPGLIILREIGRQREVAIKNDTPGKERAQLEAEHHISGSPHPEQRLAAPFPAKYRYHYSPHMRIPI